MLQRADSLLCHLAILKIAGAKVGKKKVPTKCFEEYLVALKKFFSGVRNRYYKGSLHNMDLLNIQCQ
jgi:hypothetical protein